MPKTAAPHVTYHGRDKNDGNEPSCAISHYGDTVEVFYSNGQFYIELTRTYRSGRTSNTRRRTIRLTAGEVRNLADLLDSSLDERGAVHIDSIWVYAWAHTGPVSLDFNRDISFAHSPQLAEWAAQTALLLRGVTKWREAGQPEALAQV